MSESGGFVLTSKALLISAIVIANTWVMALAGAVARSSRSRRALAVALRALFTSAEKWQPMIIFIDWTYDHLHRLDHGHFGFDLMRSTCSIPSLLAYHQTVFFATESNGSLPREIYDIIMLHPRFSQNEVVGEVLDDVPPNPLLFAVDVQVSISDLSNMLFLGVILGQFKLPVFNRDAR